MHFPGIPDLRFARNDKGEESKEEQLLFSSGYLVVKGAQKTEVQSISVFQETPCSCHHQSKNYLMILLDKIIYQQVLF